MTTDLATLEANLRLRQKRTASDRAELARLVGSEASEGRVRVAEAVLALDESIEEAIAAQMRLASERIAAS